MCSETDPIKPAFDERVDTLFSEFDDTLVAKWNGETFSIRINSKSFGGLGLLDCLLSTLMDGEVISVKINGVNLEKKALDDE